MKNRTSPVSGAKFIISERYVRVSAYVAGWKKATQTKRELEPTCQKIILKNHFCDSTLNRARKTLVYLRCRFLMSSQH